MSEQESGTNESAGAAGAVQAAETVASVETVKTVETARTTGTVEVAAAVEAVEAVEAAGTTDGTDPAPAGPNPVGVPFHAPGSRTRTLRILGLSVFLYVAQSIIVKLTAKDSADGTATVVIGAFTMLFGVTLVGLALPADYVAALRLRLRTRRDAVTADAVVAALVSFHGTDFHYPVYDFAAPDGTPYRAADPSGRALKVGTVTRVRHSGGEAVGPFGGLHALLFALTALLGLTIALIMPVLTVKSMVG